jgi:hypothetical protein
MTLPDERYRAIAETYQLLVSVSKTTSIPTRDEWIKTAGCAQTLLRHYPAPFDLDMLARAAPSLISKEMDPLYELCAVYQVNSQLAIALGASASAYRSISPVDRYRAIKHAGQWLATFINRTYSSGIKQWPESVRLAAELREHFPIQHELALLEQAMPHLLAKTMHPLHRMCRVHAETVEKDAKLLARASLPGRVD